MGSGYVSHFSNGEFQTFFIDTVNINIYDDKYACNGDSKAKRLRAFWSQESDQTVGKLLKDMLDYWLSQKKNTTNQEITDQERRIFDQCKNTVEKLLGKKLQFEDLCVGISEDEFINREFKDIFIDKLELDTGISEILKQRLEEINLCIKVKAPLAVVFLCGSTLEGILLGVAIKNSELFNKSPVSPKDKKGKVKKFQDWDLNSFIDVAYSLKLLDENIKKFAHSLRYFRNYIHPNEQMCRKFNPDEHTAKICWSVLQAAIAQLTKKTILSKF